MNSKDELVTFELRISRAQLQQALGVPPEASDSKLPLMPARAALPIKEACAYLGGVGVSTLYQKAKEHGIKPNIFERWPIAQLDRLANILKAEDRNRP